MFKVRIVDDNFQCETKETIYVVKWLTFYFWLDKSNKIRMISK